MEDYQKFYRGKNIHMSFNRQVNELYMLKRNGYYCFIHKPKTGNLSILNGGSLKHLPRGDLQFFYDNMPRVIERIEAPLSQYTEVQKKVSDAIRSFGGSGTIHGAIVDISFFSHIYVNPNDGTLIPYYATDIIQKWVYSSLADLLKVKEPELYGNYERLLSGNMPDALLVAGSNEMKEAHTKKKVELYFETDIYKASRIIKKMQKLQDHILNLWDEDSALALGSAGEGLKSLSE